MLAQSLKNKLLHILETLRSCYVTRLPSSDQFVKPHIVSRYYAASHDPRTTSTKNQSDTGEQELSY